MIGQYGILVVGIIFKKEFKMKDELKACKCGSIDVEYCTMHEIPSVRCHGCGDWLLKYGGTKEQAIATWNTRHVDLEGLEELTEIAKQSRYFIIDARGSWDTFQGEMLLKRIDDYLNKNSQPPLGSI